MHKALLSLSLLLFISIYANAQISKGSVLLGGDLGVFLLNTKDASNRESKTSGFSISPTVGKAVKDNLVIGGLAKFETTKAVGIAQTQKSNQYSAGIFVRKYKELGKSDFYFFLQSALRGDIIRQKIYDNTSSTYTNQTIVGVSVSPGVAYAVSKKVQLELGVNDLASLNYIHSESSAAGPTGKNVTNGFALSTNLTRLQGFYIGFRFVI